MYEIPLIIIVLFLGNRLAKDKNLSNLFWILVEAILIFYILDELSNHYYPLPNIIETNNKSVVDIQFVNLDNKIINLTMGRTIYVLEYMANNNSFKNLTAFPENINLNISTYDIFKWLFIFIYAKGFELYLYAKYYLLVIYAFCVSYIVGILTREQKLEIPKIILKIEKWCEKILIVIGFLLILFLIVYIFNYNDST